MTVRDPPETEGFCSNEQLLEQLRDYVIKNGRISCKDMTPRNRLATAETYWRRFGSLWKVYELAGLTADAHPSLWKHKTRSSRFLRVKVGEEFPAALVASDLCFRVETRVYYIDGYQPFLLDVAKCLPLTKKGELRWDIYTRKDKQNIPLAIGRLKPGNREVQDWLLLSEVPQAVQRLTLKDGVMRSGDSVR